MLFSVVFHHESVDIVNAIMLSIKKVNVFVKYCEAMCHYALCHFAEFLGECSNAAFCYTDICSLAYHFTEHHYAEGRYDEFPKLIKFIQSVIKRSVVSLLSEHSFQHYFLLSFIMKVLIL